MSNKRKIERIIDTIKQSIIENTSIWYDNGDTIHYNIILSFIESELLTDRLAYTNNEYDVIVLKFNDSTVLAICKDTKHITSIIISNTIEAFMFGVFLFSEYGTLQIQQMLQPILYHNKIW